MDFVNNGIAQLSDLFRSMTPSARVIAGLLLAVVVVSVSYLFQQSSAGPDAFLFGGEQLPDSQLTRIEAAIAQAQLNDYVREGNRIRVPAGQKAAYLAAVADAGVLPANFNTILEQALNNGKPWESGQATRERLKNAKERTLSEIVRAMPWVNDAVVLCDEQQSRGLRDTKQVTASVSVLPAVGESLDPRRVQALQKLIAGSVLGMAPENVTVTNLGEGGLYSGSSGDYPAELFTDEWYKTKVVFEQQRKSMILNALRDIPGVRVEVNADLDDIVEEVTRGVKPDPLSTTPVREVTTTEESNQTTVAGGGQPGTSSQGPGRNLAEAPQRQNQSRTTSETTETENDVGKEERTVLKKGATPKEVWATVTIPSSYIESIWRQRNPTATDTPRPEDLQFVQTDVVTKIENIVEPLLYLRINKGEDNYKHVRVSVVDALPVPSIEPPSMADNALAWTGRYWGTLAMLGVAMFSLLVLRSAVKLSPPSKDSPHAPAPGLTLHADEPVSRDSAPEDDTADRPRLRLKKGKSLKDDLVDIVREDPDAAADILRSWIGKAG